MWNTLFLLAGGLAGAAGVALAAVTAHGLQARLDSAAIANLETVSLYLLVHGLLLLVIAALLNTHPAALSLRLAGVAVLIGIIAFCGGLSMSAFTGVRAFTTVAPFGGTSLIIGWVAMIGYGLTK